MWVESGSWRYYGLNFELCTSTNTAAVGERDRQPISSSYNRTLSNDTWNRSIECTTTLADRIKFVVIEQERARQDTWSYLCHKKEKPLWLHDSMYGMEIKNQCSLRVSEWGFSKLEARGKSLRGIPLSD
jgi:hypothetical protein